MAEVGLVRFAQVALDIAQATVPRYRTTFSKHQFTQPQLLAILCLMRSASASANPDADTHLKLPAGLVLNEGYGISRG